MLARLPRPLLIGFAAVGHRMMEARHLRGIQRRSTANTGRRRRERTWRKPLLTCGILASRPLRRDDLVVGILWDGYSAYHRRPSELSAIGAPTRPLWMWLGAIYTVLVIAFGWGVWKSAGRNRALRIVGGLLMPTDHGVLWPFWPPMHQREVLAAGGGTMTRYAAHRLAVSPCLLHARRGRFWGSRARKRFRLYSIATW